MLKNDEIREKYPFFRKGLNNFEAEWITCGFIYRLRKREWKDYCDFVDIEYQKRISHSVTRLTLFKTLRYLQPFLVAFNGQVQTIEKSKASFIKVLSCFGTVKARIQ